MDRDEAVDAVVKALRRVNFEGTLFGQSIAIRLGLTESDIAAIEWLVDLGPSTAGRLAELMGLTTGAVTRMIDRLEQSGYVRRTSDPADRRRVVIEVVPERAAAVREMLSAIGRAGSREIGRYTEAQLALIGDFLAKMAEVTREEADRLRDVGGSPSAASAGPSEHSAALGGLASARLAFRSGAPEVQLRGAAGLNELYRAKFDGATPQVRVRDGTVSVQYRGLLFDWRKRRAEVTLNASIPWAIELHGGSARCRAAIGTLDLSSLTVSGGVGQLELDLGQPRDRVPIQVTGGAKTVRVRRPSTAALWLRVEGGVERVEFDGQRVGPTTDLSLHSPGAGQAQDRYDVVINGGAWRVFVTQAD
jgi:DNA-binding MarR family transcriptional regulator